MRKRTPRKTRSRTPYSESDIVRLSTENEEGCWIWNAKKDRRGYGYCRVAFSGGTIWGAHRASYLAFNKRLTEGLVIHHTCNVPACVNPQHLQEVTQKENILAGSSPSALQSRRIVCKRGHVFDLHRTRKDGRSERICSVCQRDRQKKPLCV